MDRKLQLSDFCMYIPYGLSVSHKSYDYPFFKGSFTEREAEIRLISKECICFDGNFENYYFDESKNPDHRENTEVYPLLRPTSCLYARLPDGSVPIEVIGKMYEPKGKLYEDDSVTRFGWNTATGGDDYQGYEIGWRDKEGWFGLYFDEYDFNNQDENFTGDYIPFDFDIYKYLVSNLFDITGLINLKLAKSIYEEDNI